MAEQTGGASSNAKTAQADNGKAAQPAAPSDDSTKPGKGEDAITLLKNDHRKVEQLFEQFEKAARRSEKQKLAKQICLELIIHTKLEEEIFYPACREHMDDDLLDEAQVEHDGAKVLINELLSGSPEQPYYDAKVKVLSEMIKHHVGEEEKRNEGIFAKAKAGGVDTDEIAQQLTARKAELMAKAQQTGPERPKPRSFTTNLMETNMPQGQYRDRDDRGRFSGDDDDDRRYSSSRSRGGGSRFDDDDRADRSRSGRMPERDQEGRFMSDDDDRRGSSRSRGGRSNDDDDRSYSSRSSGSYEDDERSSSRSRGGSRYGDDDDRGGRSGGRGQGGWFGDSEGHSMAARQRSGGSSRSRDDDDDRSSSSGRSSGSRERDDRGRFMSDDDDDRRSSSSRSRGGSSRADDDDDGDGRGWYGDAEGHAEASRRGWEHRSGGRSSNSGNGRSQSARGGASRSRDDDDRRSSSSSSSNRGRSRDSQQGGWFGDSEGHSEAARRGWENR